MRLRRKLAISIILAAGVLAVGLWLGLAQEPTVRPQAAAALADAPLDAFFEGEKPAMKYWSAGGAKAGLLARAELSHEPSGKSIVVEVYESSAAASAAADAARTAAATAMAPAAAAAAIATSPALQTLVVAHANAVIRITAPASLLRDAAMYRAAAEATAATLDQRAEGLRGMVARLSATTPRAATRPAQWAQPLEKPGLPNLHRVSDTLYRGAQPTTQGYAQLREMGVKTVVNLRTFHGEADEVRAAGMQPARIWSQAFHAEDEDIVKFLRLASDPARQPVYVHCMQGADRTGLMAAVYRVCVQGWSKDDAIAEMTGGGFGHHAAFGNLSQHIRDLDVARVRKQAGIDP
jgi:protein tyrosine phosphatase (PTP) superfamily phosphohydrolase (DUF442 family)